MKTKYLYLLSLTVFAISCTNKKDVNHEKRIAELTGIALYIEDKNQRDLSTFLKYLEDCDSMDSTFNADTTIIKLKSMVTQSNLIRKNYFEKIKNTKNTDSLNKYSGEYIKQLNSIYYHIKDTSFTNYKNEDISTFPLDEAKLICQINMITDEDAYRHQELSMYCINCLKKTVVKDFNL